MPALEAGDVELAKKLARSNVDSLLPHARQGKKILAINPTCSYMLKKEYPELLGNEEARQVGQATMDLCEYLFSLKQAGRFCRDFRSTPTTIAYHLPCHLKAQNIGFRSRDILRLLPETKVTLVDQCCGHDGTWAMKQEFFPLSKQAGKKAFEQMAAANAGVLASDCPLAAIQFEQALGQLPLHPIQILARAYESEGFAKRIEPPVQGGPADASP
jgi:glycerol-3-phosphate dehydrogenase subunit C